MRRHIEAYEERVYDMDFKILKLEEKLIEQEKEHQSLIKKKSSAHQDLIRKKDKE